MPILSASRKLLRRRWLRWGIIVLVTYTIIGFLILPLIVRTVAVKQLSTQLDRQVSIRKVRINPYALSGSIQGLLVKDKDGEPFISWDEIYGNFQLSSFFGKAWVFKEVYASNPFIRVQINKDYTFNFSDLLKKFAAEPSAPPKPSKPLVLRIERFHIGGAQAKLTDLTPPTPFHRTIGPLEITLTGFHTDPESRNPYAFEGTTDAGEHFSWNGYFSLDPLRSAGEISFDGFSLPKYSPLYEDLVRFEIRDGVMGFRAAYDLSLNGTNWLGTVSNAAVHLKNFRTAEKSATNNLLEVDSLAVEGVAADAAARTAEIATVKVNGARLAAKRERSGDLNLVTISQPAVGVTNTPGGILLLLQAATNAVAALINTTNLWSATLDDLQVTNCALAWEDAATRRQVHAVMDQVAVTGKHLSNIPGSNQTVTVSLRWNTNGLVRLRAEAQIDPPSVKAAIQVTNVDLQPIDPYLEPFVNAYIRRSKLAVDGHLQMRSQSNSLPDATFIGSVQMNDFSSVDGFAENDLLKWSSFGINDISATLNPPGITVKTIVLADPVAHVAIDTNSQLNVLAILRAEETNQAPQSAAPPIAQSKAVAKGGMSARFGGMLRQVLDSNTNSGAGGLPAINVDRIAISNGLVQFEDRSIQPPVNTSVEALNGAVVGFSSSNLKRADVSFSGKVSRTGPFEITGKINPLSTNAPTELLVKLNDVDLRAGSPYSGKFLGYKLNRGFLTLAVNYHVADRKLIASNVVIVDHLTLGEKVDSPDATKLPVRLAVALLKDRNGRILLDVPIDGDLDDPNFHFGRVIGHVIGNVITKLVTSPFAALGSVFGGKGEDVSFIDFDPGRSNPTPNAEQKIETLLRGLDERPGLQLEISGGFDPASDGAVIRQDKLEQELRRHRWTLLRKSVQAQTRIEDIQLTDSDRTDALNALFQAISKTNSQVLQPVTPGAQAKVRPPPSIPAKADSTRLDHGAELLVRSSAAPARRQPLGVVEMQLLAVMPVSEAELRKLASARASFMQQKLKDSGKIASDRVVLAERGAVSTNQAARVFFNLR